MHPRSLTARRLQDASLALRRLETEGVAVLTIRYNGRRPVLVVDRRPKFATGVLRRRSPLIAGIERIYATPYFGVQIEWADTSAPPASRSRYPIDAMTERE